MQMKQDTEKDIKNPKEEEPKQCQTETNASSPLANSSHSAFIKEKVKIFIQTPQWNLMTLTVIYPVPGY